MFALFEREVIFHPLCPLCKDFPETVEHVLFLCSWTCDVWFASALNYQIDLQAITTFDKWFFHIKDVIGRYKENQFRVYTIASLVC